MPRKKSVRRTARDFRARADSITAFLAAVEPSRSDEQVSWLYEYAIIRLYREFERMVLGGLVGAINNDTTTISSRVGINFPKHLTDEVCEFLVIGDGFFDFRGRDGLIRTLKRFVPENHYLIQAVRKDKYRSALGRLSALRNLAAHDSSVSRQRAKEAVGQIKIGSAGSWLKRQCRFTQLVARLKELSEEIEAGAPY